MTRINLLETKDLADQHLMAEYRELPRIFGLVKKAQSKGLKPSDCNIPKSYRLGTGHVKFFYDKLMFLVDRHTAIVKELLCRGYQIKNVETLYDDSIAYHWYGHFTPTHQEYQLSKQRINEKLKQNPNFYRWSKGDVK